MTDSRVVIVDPFSSGALLGDELRSRGVACAAVVSSPRLPAAMQTRFVPDDRWALVHTHVDPAATLTALRRFAPTHVLAGFESGVELADWLTAELSLPGHDSGLARARRDKWLMSRAARQRGLRTAEQIRSTDAAEAVGWVQRASSWPVIVKPLRSVASDQVFLCADAGELAAAFTATVGQLDALGERNVAVLVQEFLAGTEYAVDTVSYDGQKQVTAIWQYHRPPARRGFVCYDAMSLQPYRGERQDRLRAFAFAAMDSLGIRYGPAHCEIMWVAGEPVLIEIGARLTAGNNATLSRSCGGLGQLNQTVAAVLTPRRFLESLEQSPQLSRRAANVFLLPPRPGRLVRAPQFDWIAELPTVQSVSTPPAPGTVLGRVAGLATLIHEDIDAIHRDIRRIRELVDAGLFAVE